MKKDIPFYRLVAIYIVSTVVASFIFSFITTILIVFGIEEQGGDPGAPIIMLIGLIMLCLPISWLAATIMFVAKYENQKELSVKVSIVMFLLTYLPFHVLGFYDVKGRLDFLAIPFSLLQLVSYALFFHLIAQTFINLLLRDR